MHRLFTTALAIGATLLVAAISFADDTNNHDGLSIEAQPLASALREFSEQTGLQIGYATELVEGKETHGVRGADDPELALDTLLASTGLEHQFVNEKTVVIREATTTALAEDSESGKSRPAPSSILAQAPAGLNVESRSKYQSNNEGGSLRGTVRDLNTGTNLVGALVRIVETGQETSTDDLGRFRFANIRPGRHTLEISYLGYETGFSKFALGGGDVYEIELSLRVRGGPLEEIVVFGTRSARAASLNQERTALNSSSVISVDRLGSFAGTNLADALRRVPGITFQSGVAGRGSRVNIRGLGEDMNGIKINGIDVPGANRFPDISNLLVDSFDKITIHKTLLPSHDSAGAGGLIEIETKSPLSEGRRHASFRYEGGRMADDFGDDLLLSGTVSGAFGPSETFGLSASVQYHESTRSPISNQYLLRFGQHLPLREDGTLATSLGQINPLTPFPFENGVDGAYPIRNDTSLNESDQDELAVTLSGEWQVADHTNIQLDLQRSIANTDEFERFFSFSTLSRYREIPVDSLGGELRRALVLDPSDRVRIFQEYNNLVSETESSTYSLRVNTELKKWKVDQTLGFGRGTRKQPVRTDLAFAFGGDEPVALDPNFVSAEVFDPLEGRAITIFGRRETSGYQLPLLTEAGFDFVNDPTSYSLESLTRANPTNSKNTHHTAEINAEYDIGGEHLKYSRFGIKYKGSKFGVANPEFVDLFTDFPPPNISDVGLSLDEASLSSIGVSQGFNLVTRANYNAFFENLPNLLAATNPLITQFERPVHPDSGNQFMRENTFAAYFEQRLDIGKLEIIGGVRWNRVSAQDVRLSSPIIFDENFQRDLDFETEFGRLVNLRGTEDELLPRIGMNYRQTDSLIFRGGYFLTSARPPLRDLSGEQQITLFLAPFGGPDNNQPTLRVFQGNPDLEPGITHNFDASVEYYDDRIGAIKLSGFYKKIDNFLEHISREDSNVLDGLALPDHPAFQEDLPENIFVEASFPVNSNDSARIWGVEAHVERQLTFLPGFLNGFGVFANYTYTESSKRDTLRFNQSPIFDENGNIVATEAVDIDVRGPFTTDPSDSGTVALTYSKHDIDANLAYSFQSARQSQISAHNLGRFSGENKTLDLHFEYRFELGSGSYRVYLDGRNILKDSREVTGETFIGGIGSTPRFRTAEFFTGNRELLLGIAGSFE